VSGKYWILLIFDVIILMVDFGKLAMELHLGSRHD
jgi:hypothetical protein